MWRDGKLVRMDVGAALPERCVACNGPAVKRISRTLYWSPAVWRLVSAITPLAFLAGGVLLGMPVLTLLFWPAAIVFGIVQYVVRRKLKLDLPICARHRRQRNVLQALSLAALVGVVLIFLNLTAELWTLLIAATAILIVLAVVQSFAGVQAVSLKQLDAEHAWLGGIGKSFREALPELPGA